MSVHMKKVVVIVAGGSGSRMGSQLPKQFIEIGGKPILMHTIECFFAYDKSMEVRLVLPTEHIPVWQQLCEKHYFLSKHTVCQGGANRFESVKNGLFGIPGDTLIAIHDGVRPCVSIDTIKRSFEKAEECGAAIPVTDVFETIREISSDHSETVDRDKFKLVQTPQVFLSDILLKAYEQDFNEKFTDDASVVEAFGIKVCLVEGNRENIKITTPFDLKIAETQLLNQ